MTPALRLLRGTVSAMVLVLALIGFSATGSASRLTGLQKFLTKKIEGSTQ